MVHEFYKGNVEITAVMHVSDLDFWTKKVIAVELSHHLAELTLLHMFT